MSLYDGLNMLWPMDDASSSPELHEIIVYGSNNNNLITASNLTKDTSGPAGIIGQAFATGHSASQSNGSANGISTAGIDFAVSCWVMLTDKTADHGIICGFGGGNTDWKLIYDHTADRFEFITGTSPSGVTANTFGSPSTGTWYHIAASRTLSGNFADIYVNGIFDRATGGTGSATFPTLTAGQTPVNGYLVGSLAQVVFYQRALNGADVGELYNGGAGNPYPFTGPGAPSGSGFGPPGGNPGEGGGGTSGGSGPPPPVVVPIPGGTPPVPSGPTPIPFECSYAGVALAVPTPELRAKVDLLLSTMDMRDLQPPPYWPGKQLASLANWDVPPYPAPRLGQLFWPAGAKRWSVGYFLATGAQIAQIRYNFDQLNNTTLILKAGSGDNADNPLTITTMFMLPPRPLLGLFSHPLPQFVLNQVPVVPDGIEKDLYLLVLVDYRYYIAQQAWVGPWLVESAVTKPPKWEDIFAAVPAVTSQAYTFGSVYGIASLESAFFSFFPKMSLILDATAFNAGRGVYSRYDGQNSLAPLDGLGYLDVKTWHDAMGSTRTQSLRWATQRIAGGVILSVPESMTDYDNYHDFVLPDNFRTFFPTWRPRMGYDDYYGGESPYSWNRHWNVDAYPNQGYQDTAASALDWIPGSNGFAPDVVFFDTAKAHLDSGGSALTSGAVVANHAALVALAKQQAQDYVYWILGRMDATYAGICPWTQDGLNDVTYYYNVDLSYTRVQGPPLNSYPRDFQHEVGYDSGTGAPPGYDFDTLWLGRPRVRAVGIFTTDNASPTSSGGHLYYSAQGVAVPNAGEGAAGAFGDDTIAGSTSIWLTPRDLGASLTLDHSGTKAYEGVFIGYFDPGSDLRALYMVGSAALI